MERLFDKWQTDQERELLCSELIEKYELYARKLFHSYEPLSISNLDAVPRDFFQRLELWLNNYQTDADQWEAFQLVDDIFYIGRNELIELYRVAFEKVVPEWLCEIKGIDLRSKTFNQDVDKATGKTWFCPITDSLRISAFRHINHIEKPEYFPDWRSLEVFGDEKKLKDYIAEKKFEQIVMVEDFVGSGKQVTPAIEFAKRVCDIPVLVLPLVVGAVGDGKLSEIARLSALKISYRPVMVLAEDSIVTRAVQLNEALSSTRARELIASYTKITGDADGFGFEVDQGYLFVAEANCPNNTIKPIYAKSSWSPLFPRSGRKKK
jgi:hypothetical protein